MIEAVTFFDSPVGWLQLAAHDEGVTSIAFLAENPASPEDGRNTRTAGAARALKHLEKLHDELQAYFAGSLKEFTVPVHFIDGTEFQQRVWRGLLQIPFGQTWSYKELAAAVNHPKSMRAVGNANGKNPIPIIVPCHRVIAHDGSLGGYSSGLEIKRKLLRLEAA
jgi:methylated-DNA-[protein]-cysteine S-methyltransferase